MAKTRTKGSGGAIRASGGPDISPAHRVFGPDEDHGQCVGCEKRDVDLVRIVHGEAHVWRCADCLGGAIAEVAEERLTPKRSRKPKLDK